MNINHPDVYNAVMDVVFFLNISLPGKLYIYMPPKVDDFSPYSRLIWDSSNHKERIGGKAEIYDFEMVKGDITRQLLKERFAFDYLTRKHTAGRFIRQALQVYGRYEGFTLVESLVAKDAFEVIRRDNPDDGPVDGGSLLSAREAVARVLADIEERVLDQVSRERGTYLSMVNSGEGHD